ARFSEPGAHQVSSSLKATKGVVTCSTPKLRPAAPLLLGLCTRRTCGCRRTNCTVSSLLPLSTTMIGGFSGKAVNRCRQRSSSCLQPYGLAFHAPVRQLLRSVGNRIGILVIRDIRVRKP